MATKGEMIEIQARQEDAYKTNRATVTTGVAARIGTDEICFLVNPAALEAPRLFVNKKEIALFSFTQLPLANGNQLRVAAKEKLVFTNAQGEGVTIRWNTPYLDYAVMLGDARKGNVTGLMGNFDGDDKNDFKLANGTAIERSFPTIHTTFADSWRITSPNSLLCTKTGKPPIRIPTGPFPKRFR